MGLFIADVSLWDFFHLDKVMANPWWFALLSSFIVCAIIVNFIAVYAGVNTLLERKIAAHMQARVGPYQVGPHGSLQWLADALKLMVKEDVIPTDTDKLLFRLAPYVVFGGSFAAWVALPYTVGWSPAIMNVGILYILAVSSAVVIGILMAGWSSGSKWALFGAMRSAAQIVSYEVPVGIALLGMLLIYGSLDMQEISAAQEKGAPFGFAADWHGGILSWGIFRFPPFTIFAFLIYYTAGLAETNRTPFDIPEAESELVAGYHTEYSGMRFSFFFLAEYANMFVVAAIATTFFLGGWLPPFGHLLGSTFLMSPFLEGLFWFMTKSFALVVLMMWLRWTLPRYRVDQLMDLCWKRLTPLAFVTLFAIGAGVYNSWVGLILGSAVGLATLALIGKEVIAAPPPEGLPPVRAPIAAK
ncbi:MAG TPA: NADH-quinone oxidoreductase subunit NuoH [Planctomycetota bacterium]|nr:NADH-quinone oxidoreductase subunit NuoH [Planctomycetota bacterium]